MTVETTPTPDAPVDRPQRCRRRGRIALFAVVLALLAGIGGIVATKGVSHARGAFGHGFMPGVVDPAKADRRAVRAMRHLAVEVDATPEQTEKLVAIARAAVKDLLPLREQLVAGRGQIADLLLAPMVDKAGIEKMRTEKLALVDQATRRITQALGEASEVLDAAQRRQLVARVDEFRERRGQWGFHRWMHRG